MSVGNNSTSFGVYNFIGILDREIGGITVHSTNMPPIVNTRPFMGGGTKAKTANKVFSVLLRPTRRATRDYWHAQNEVNHRLLQKIAILESRIQDLESKRGGEL